MTKFDDDFDYLLLLGIDPANALGSPGAFAEQIKSRKKEWTAQALNPLYQQAARTSLERAREFESLLAEPAALAAYVNHVKECRVALRAEHESTLVGLIALAAGARKELTALQRDLLLKEVKSEGLPPSLLDEVLKSRAVAIVAARKSESAEQVKLPLQAPALDSVVFTEIQNWLKVLSKGSLYELLDLPTTTPPPRLTSQAQLQFAHWSKVLPKTNTSTAWEKTLQASLTYLKDAESKAKYDRSLFNFRVQKLVSRIDLVLAGSSFAIDEATNLVRMGVQEFGFTEAIVEQCLAARMAFNKVSAGEKAPVVVQVQGQIRCRRCGAWNGSKVSKCRECGSSLHRKCENPACTNGLMPVDVKACTECGLPIVRGVKYRTLLQMADAYLQTGSHQAALSVCQAAEQILPGPAIEARLARASRVRALASAALDQAAAQAWTAVRATLKELITVAPRITISGVPTLEKVTQFVAETTEKIRAVPPESSAVDAARVYLSALRRWSDCEEAFRKLRQICTRLESDRDPVRALQVAGKLLELRPADPDLKATAIRLEGLAKEAEFREKERKGAEREYLSAIRESRLYAAERSLHAIERAAEGGPPLAGADDLRRKLAAVQRELGELRQAATQGLRGDALISRYLDLLTRCRDCREALLELQSLPIESPSTPEGLAVRREGNRRVLSWRPGAAGKRPTSYVVQRSITRPASRQVDPPFQTIYEGDSLYFSDDEVAHGGVILRYMVHAVARGRIEVEGTTIRTYETFSAPAAFEGVLIWQEVMNLRSTRRDRALELNWFVPTGARQVLIERWPGGPNDHGLGAMILPATADGRLIDDGLGEKMIHTYRISCVYDGPEGEFRTPGVCLTDGISGSAPRTLEDQSPAA
jgi:ribosomal protein L40E